MATATTDQADKALLTKIAWRLVPFMALLYFVSFLDRVNVGFAALTMNEDIGLSASAFGFGAGVFFIGYVLFEVPSNLILKRVGARLWIARIMVTWGILSAATAFVTGPVSFAVVRFLLGVAEAGFFPGMILYMTYWFPSAIRGRVMGSFLVAVPLSSAIGAPVSTALLDLSVFGMAGWQTMFLLEGIPAVLLGICVLFLLPDRPRTAKFLSEKEKVALETMLAKEAGGADHTSLRDGLLSPRVWRFALIYLALVLGLYGFGFWAPQMIQGLGDLSNFHVGLIAIIPFALAAVAMVVWGQVSDRARERKTFLAIPAFLGAAGFLVSAFAGDPVVTVAAFTIGAIGIYASLPVFWTLPTAMLSGTAAAGGIALINAVGNLGGYLGPFAIGSLLERTGSYASGLVVISVVLLIGGVLALAGKGERDLRRGKTA